jgi:hypothetical protein
MAADVPAHITQPAFVQNGVKVQAGTNWDFSRTAVATPIVALPDPKPVFVAVPEPVVPLFTQYVDADKMPGGAPVASPVFSENLVLLSAAARQEIRQLDKGVRYVVAGHADAGEKNAELLARQRANAVAAQMKRQGFKVASVKSFGERRPLSTDRSYSSANRRVDIVESH